MSDILMRKRGSTGKWHLAYRFIWSYGAYCGQEIDNRNMETAPRDSQLTADVCRSCVKISEADHNQRGKCHE